MISAQTIAKLESDALGMSYILGARMRKDKSVRDEVLPSAEKFQVVDGNQEEGGGIPRRFPCGSSG